MILRPAEPDDAMAVARVHICSWQIAYRGLLPQDYLDRLRPEDRAAKYDFAATDPIKPRTIVAVETGEIVGFATTAPSRDLELKDHGELYAVYVHPGSWGKGIGVALIEAARKRLKELQFQNALLWVLVGNARAERFYRADGWSPDGVTRTDTVWNVTVNERRFLRSLRQ